MKRTTFAIAITLIFAAFATPVVARSINADLSSYAQEGQLVR